MNKENTQYLYTKYPVLYGGHEKSIMESLMPFGFEHGDGWFKLIDELSAKIVAVDPECQAVQVKEKYGGLRFYMGPISMKTSDKIYKLISKYEKKSYKVCEECGTEENVTVNDVGWISTLCDSCRNEMNKKMGKSCS